MADNKLRGTLLVLLCVALWGLIPVVAKTGQKTLDNHQFLFWSSLVSFLVLFGSALFRDGPASFRALSIRDFLWLGLLGLLGTYIYYLFLYLGYARANGMEVLVVQYSWPLLIVLLSVPLLGEKLGLKKILAVGAGFFGVIIVLTKGDFSRINFSGFEEILLVAAGAFCFALFSVLSKNIRQKPLTAISIYFLAALIASFISMLYFSGFAAPTDRQTALAILLNGVLVNGFSYLFWIGALRAAEASYIAPFTYLAPIVSAFYLIVFFDEPFLAAYGIGLLLVVGGGLVNALAKDR